MSQRRKGLTVPKFGQAMSLFLRREKGDPEVQPTDFWKGRHTGRNCYQLALIVAEGNPGEAILLSNTCDGKNLLLAKEASIEFDHSVQMPSIN